MVEIKRGDIFLAKLEPTIGREQGGIRPVLILQNNLSNKYSPIVIVTSLTSKIYNKEYPTNVFISKQDSKLDKDSTILLNQLRAIDKKRIIKKLSSLDNFTMHKVDMALKISLGLN
jgi:mRNA interferase MazF